MRFSVAAVLAFATATLAQTAGFDVITKPTEGEKVPAGSTYEIVWQPSAEHPGDITIGLLGGATPGTLAVLDVIADGVDGSAGSYSWEVPAKLGDLATYGIMITLESDVTIFQYGFPFQIVSGGSDGGKDSTSTTASASASASGTASESESSTSSSTESSTVISSSSTTSFSVPSSTIVSSTIRGNYSTTAGGPKATITDIVTAEPTPTKSSTSTIATNGVASLAAGSFAMLGGVAMAVLAL